MNFIMKKTLELTVLALTMVSLVGCGAEGDKGNWAENKEEQPQIEEQEQQLQVTSYLGKVEKMVGNEISLKLSNDNYTPLEDESEDEEALEFTLDESQFSQLENGETFTLPNGVVIKGNSTEFSSSESSDENPGVSEESMISQGGLNFDQFSRLTFNGETKDLVIPAGAKIFNGLTGEEALFSDIKKGSILSVTMNSENNTVISIDILG